MHLIISWYEFMPDPAKSSRDVVVRRAKGDPIYKDFIWCELSQRKDAVMAVFSISFVESQMIWV